MRHALDLMGLACLLALALPGQGEKAPSLPPTQDELRRTLEQLNRQRMQGKASLERLLDLRIRHDLALSIDAGGYLALAPDEHSKAPAEMQLAIAAAERERVDLVQRLRNLEQSLDTESKLSIEQARHMSREIAAAKPDPQPAKVARPVSTSRLVKVRPARTRHGETRPGPSREIVLLRGSKDHGRVGRALFRAGRFDAAVRELQVLYKAKTAKRIDMFYLARAFEKLGQLDKADDLFARIEALGSKDGKETLSAWGRAARTSRQQMSWMRDRATWKPARAIDSIKWKR